MTFVNSLDERSVAVIVHRLDVRASFINEKPGELVFTLLCRLEQQGIRIVSMRLFSDRLALWRFFE